jgi:hypothetical protein
VAAQPMLMRDPITQRYICRLCWNQMHGRCHHADCNCLHHEATDARVFLAGAREEDEADEDD